MLYAKHKRLGAETPSHCETLLKGILGRLNESIQTNFCSLLLEGVEIPCLCFLARVVYHTFSCFFLRFKINILSTVSVFLTAVSYLQSLWSWTTNSVLTSIYNAEFFNNIVLDEYSKITACHFNE